MKRSVACMLAVWAIPACLASAANPGADLVAAGNARAAWILYQDSPTTYDLVAKPAGEKWKWVAHKLPGKPLLAVALDDQLHVLLTNFDYAIFDLDADRPISGLRPNHPRWPRRASVLAACPSGPIRGVQPAQTILVVLAAPPPPAAPASAPATRQTPASRPASAPASAPTPAPTSVPATAPASAPATASAPAPAPAPQGMALFFLQAGRWTYLEDIPAPAAVDVRRVFLASLDGQLYLLLHGRDSTQLLVRDRTGLWAPPRAMPELLPPAYAPIALVAVKDSLVLARRLKAQPAATRPVANEVSLVGLEKDLNVSPAQPVALEGRSIGRDVRAFAYADGLALVWGQTPAPAFAACDPSGTVKGGVESVDILVETPTGDQASLILVYFFYTLMGVSLAAALLRPLRTPRTPFALPDRLRPARVGRRVAAYVVDMLPFTFIATSLFPFPMPAWPNTQAEANEFLRVLFANADCVTAVVSSLSMHAIYTFLMEARMGTTLGKRLFGLWVVGAGGRKPLPLETLLRAVLRILELSTPGLPICIACLFLTRYRQRAGDILAQTAVVELLPPTASPPAPPAPPPPPAE